jgi:hypothetical protein
VKEIGKILGDEKRKYKEKLRLIEMNGSVVSGVV